VAATLVEIPPIEGHSARSNGTIPRIPKQPASDQPLKSLRSGITGLGLSHEWRAPIGNDKSLGLIGNAPAQKSLGVAEWRSPEHFR
jgi:hypothetical protein